jgi:hypothetical protein
MCIPRSRDPLKPACERCLPLFTARNRELPELLIDNVTAGAPKDATGLQSVPLSQGAMSAKQGRRNLSEMFEVWCRMRFRGAKTSPETREA